MIACKVAYNTIGASRARTSDDGLKHILRFAVEQKSISKALEIMYCFTIIDSNV